MACLCNPKGYFARIILSIVMQRTVYPLSLLAFLVLTLLGLLPVSFAQDDLEQPIAIDPSIRTGTLDNGLTYYIRKNGKPENRISMRLVVNAGSLQEDHDQQGLAHFIEHMAFNGTERFRKLDVVNFLEAAGMRFGAHLNAYTSFDETVYMLELPTQDSTVVEKGFQILEDWAGAIRFDNDEIERERGVVIEEWRGDRGVGRRLSENQYPVIYYDSTYAKRLPIGSVFTIKSAPRHRILDFYNDWYRPDLMAVIVVGNIDDMDAVEARIKRGFSGLANPEEPRARENAEIPDHENTLFSIQTDPELTMSSLSIMYKIPPMEEGTVGSYKDIILHQIYFGMLNNRLSERTRLADPPYLGAGAGKSALGRSKAATSFNVQLIEGKMEEGTIALLAEIDRVKQEGFSQTEIDRAKANYLRSMERATEELENLPSGSFASEYTRNFLTGEPIPGIEKELEMTRRFLDEMDRDEINAYGKTIPEGAENRVILYMSPEKEGLEVPSEETLLALIESGAEQQLDSYEDVVSDKPLLANLPDTGSIVEEAYHEKIDTYEWTLSNGVRVVVKPTDFKNDQILMSSFSPGGHSLVSDDEFVAAITAISILSQSGIGEFGVVELQKMLAGKVAGVSAYITNIYEGISGSSSPKDLDTFFQLLTLQALQPRLDWDAYASFKKRLEAMIVNREKSPQAAYDDAIAAVLYGDHPRHLPASPEMLKALDPELSLLVFEDRFADFSDFTFIFVGSIDVESFKGPVSQYLASLPASNRLESGRHTGEKLLEGQHEVIVARGLENKTAVRVQFMGEAEWSPENSYALAVAREILNIRLREVLREEKGGTYGVRVSGGISRVPVQRFGSGFGFTCEPERARPLIAAALSEIERLKVEGPSAVNMGKVREIHIKGYEKGILENGYWLSNLAGLLREGRDLELILDAKTRYESLDSEAVRLAFEQYFSQANRLIALMHPEGYEEK